MANHADAKEFTEANRAFFDKLSSNYNAKPWQKKMSAQIQAELRNNADTFIGLAKLQEAAGNKGVSLLDYACGTGNASLALAPYISSTTGVDISASMIEIFEKALSSPEPEGPSNKIKVMTQTGDLLSDPPSSSLDDPRFHSFDIAVVSGGFHHFADAAEAAKRLTQRLRVGGVLVVVDFLAHSHGHGHGHHGHHAHHAHNGEHRAHGNESGSDDKKEYDNVWEVHTQASHTIRTHGFTRESMEKLFEEAGLGEFGWVEMKDPIEMRFGGDAHEVADVQEGDKVAWQKGFVARGTRL